ncbi:MAG: hypothetical protein WD557_14085 [Dehalococcoidia bacterium]
MRELPVCGICGGQVTVRDAGIWVNVGKAEALVQARREWDQAHGPGVSAAELADYPYADGNPLGEVPWVWGHLSCPAGDGGDGYHFEATRFETSADALAWTFHLMEKSWFPGTDWETLVRRLHDVSDP